MYIIIFTVISRYKALRIRYTVSLGLPSMKSPKYLSNGYVLPTLTIYLGGNSKIFIFANLHVQDLNATVFSTICSLPCPWNTTDLSLYRGFSTFRSMMDNCSQRYKSLRTYSYYDSFPQYANMRREQVFKHPNPIIAMLNHMINV